MCEVLDRAESRGKEIGKEIGKKYGIETINKLYAVLLSKGLIRDEKLFVLQYYFSEFQKEVKPGTFELTTAMTVEEMMEVMASQASEDEK